MLKKREKELSIVRLLDVQWLCLNELKDVKITEKSLNCIVFNNSFSQVLTIQFPTEGGVRLFMGEGGFFKPSSLNNVKAENRDNGVWSLQSGDYTVTVKAFKSSWTIGIKDSVSKNSFLLKSSDIKVGVNSNKCERILFKGRLAENELIWGGGERYNTVILNSTAFPLWNNDCWSQDSSTYVNVPFFHSSKGYSFFYNSTYGAIADIGYTNSKKYDLDFNGSIFDIYVYLKKPLENIDSYTKITGRPFSIPKWAFGYWAGGAGVYWNSRDKDGKHNYLDIIRETVEGYKRLNTIPTALYGEDKPSNNKDAYDVLASCGIKMLGWNHPAATWGIREFTADIYRELCPGIPDSELPGIRKKENPSELCPLNRDWVWADYTHPNIGILMKNKMKKAWDFGVKGAMVDYAEYVNESMVFANGMTGDEMHNLYAYYYNKAVYEAWTDRMGDDFVLFARSGCAGSQRYCASFGGDQGSSFEGLCKALRGGISISVSGFSGWGSDIGGLGGTPTKELYSRWLELGAFSPFMRTHGPTDHNPWAYGKKAEETFKKLYWIRNGLIELLYSANLKTAQTGEPMMKPLMLCYPDDLRSWECDDQYILADELMVCPVYTEGAKQREVYFPNGNWYELFGGRKHSGAEKKTVSVPLGKPAVYLRDGAVIKTTVCADNIFFGNELNGEKLNAVLVTPTLNFREKEIITDNGNYEFTLTSNGEKSMIIKQNCIDNISVLNLLGSKIKEIKVEINGSGDIKTISADKIKYMPNQKMSAVMLPEGWKSLELLF